MLPERYNSIAFFGFPDIDATIKPYSGCIDDKIGEKWGPLNAGDYIRRKRSVLYS